MGSLFNFGRLTKVWKGLKFGFMDLGLSFPVSVEVMVLVEKTTRFM